MTIHLAGGAVTLHHGDCREVLAGLEDASISSIVTDPPYELGFMGKAWDASGIAYNVEMWRECLRVLKPGGHLLAFGGTRTYHRMAAAIEDAGFEIRDSIHWLYGSGFPKSLDVSKAIDKQRYDRDDIERVVRWMEATRQACGVTRKDVEEAFGTVNIGQAFFTITPGSTPRVPTLDQVPVLLDLFGVKVDDVPEDIRRLLWDLNGKKGQPGENWWKREVDGFYQSAPPAQTWISNYGFDANLTPKERRGTPATDAAKQWEGWGTALKPAHEPIVVARKPFGGTVSANLLQYGTGALNIDGCRIHRDSSDMSHAGQRTATFGTQETVSGGDGSGGWQQHDAGRWPANVIIDDYIADIEDDWPRYFYCAKPSKKERNAGGDNRHPTVKPVELMRWLIRLVTPPDGVVLDPFAGSGTTLAAATLEGFGAVGIELTEEYLPIITGRVTEAHITPQQLDLFGGVA